jgi:hypothetical protein
MGSQLVRGQRWVVRLAALLLAAFVLFLLWEIGPDFTIPVYLCAVGVLYCLFADIFTPNAGKTLTKVGAVEEPRVAAEVVGAVEEPRVAAEVVKQPVAPSPIRLQTKAPQTDNVALLLVLPSAAIVLGVWVALNRRRNGSRFSPGAFTST